MTLLQTKKVFNTYDIAGFDVETDEKGNFFCGVISFKDSVFSDKKSYKLFDDVKECADYILSDYYKRGYPFVDMLIGFNIAYDLNSVLDFFPVNRLERKGRFITCDFTKNIYNNDFFSKNNRNSYFTIIDLMNFFIEKPALKILAEDFNEKYIDVHDYRDERIYEACFTHSLCTRNIFDKLQKECNKFNCDIRLTGTSTARKIFTSNFLKKEHQIWDTKKFQDGKPLKYSDNELFGMKRFSKLSYYGGTVEVFKKGLIKNAVMIDRVSMYPAEMKNNGYPNPNHFWYYDFGEKKADYFNNKDAFRYEGIAEVKLKIPYMQIPPFLFTFDSDLNIYMHKCGIIEGIYTYPEIKYVLELGGLVIEVYQVLEFARFNGFFNDYVDTFFTMKRDKPDLKAFAKLMLNGLSGGFGQTNSPDIAYNFLEEGDIIDIETMFEYNGLKFIAEKKFEEESYPYYSYPAIIAYTTSYSRINLHQNITLIENDKPKSVHYCDTDSIITTNLDYDKIIKMGRELGDYEIKWMGDCEIRGLKYYRYFDNAKKEWFYRIKGVPKKQQAEFWLTENIWTKKPRHFRSAIRTGKKVNEWLNINYVRRAVKDKRKFDENGDSEPYAN